MTSDEHHREQGEAAVIEACDLLDRTSKTHLVFMKMPNGEWARKMTAPSYGECVKMIGDIQSHLSSIIADLAELSARRVDIDDREQDNDHR